MVDTIDFFSSTKAMVKGYGYKYCSSILTDLVKRLTAMVVVAVSVCNHTVLSGMNRYRRYVLFPLFIICGCFP